MANDAKLYLRSGADSGALTASDTTPVKSLPGTPMRGLECTVVIPQAANNATLALTLQEATAVNGTFYTFRQSPVPMTKAGEYHFRFHLDKGYKAVRALLTVAGSSGADLGNVDVVIGDLLGAYGNG